MKKIKMNCKSQKNGVICEKYLSKTMIFMKIRPAFFFLLGIILYSSTVFSQNLDSPIFVQPRKLPNWGGVFLGFSGNFQTGTLVTNECNCSFENGAGSGLIVGGLYEKYIGNSLNIGGAIGYENRSLTALFREREIVDLQSANGESYKTPILFRHTSDVSIQQLFVNAYAKWYPFSKVLFFKGGLTAGYMFQSSILHTKEILERNPYRLPDGSDATILFENNTQSTVIEQGDLPNASPLQFLVDVGMGIDIPFGEYTYLTPVFRYTLPLNTVTTSNPSFSVNSLQFLMELRFPM